MFSLRRLRAKRIRKHRLILITPPSSAPNLKRKPSPTPSLTGKVAMPPRSTWHLYSPGESLRQAPRPHRPPIPPLQLNRHRPLSLSSFPKGSSLRERRLPRPPPSLLLMHLSSLKLNLSLTLRLLLSH